MPVYKKIITAIAVLVSLLSSGCRKEENSSEKENYTKPAEIEKEKESGFLEKDGITGYKSEGDAELNLFGIDMQKKFDSKKLCKQYPTAKIEYFNENDEVTGGDVINSKYYFSYFKESFKDESSRRAVFFLGNAEEEGTFSFFYNASEKSGYPDLLAALEANDYGIKFKWSNGWHNTLPEVFNIDYKLEGEMANQENTYRFLLRMIEEFGKPSKMLKSNTKYGDYPRYLFFWERDNYGFSLMFADYYQIVPNEDGEHERQFCLPEAGFYSTKTVYNAALSRYAEPQWEEADFETFGEETQEE